MILLIMLLLHSIVKKGNARCAQNYLEHVADRILKRILEEHPGVEKAKVKVAKRNPPIGGNVEEVAIKRELSKICIKIRLNISTFAAWHRGRVARQSSAKACTAVRIRSMPLIYSSMIIFPQQVCLGYLLFWTFHKRARHHHL